MKPAILTFAASGTATAVRLAALLGGTIHACGPQGEDARTLLPRLFLTGKPIIGVCAAGILIRLLAPHLADKHSEPPVLAVSQDGAEVVPLLGGHHGANRLAREIAQGIGGHAALTTASDTRFAIGLDEPPPGYVLANPDAAKPAMAALLGGAAIALTGEAPWLAAAGYPLAPDGVVRITVTNRVIHSDGPVYNSGTIVAGVGCERGTDPEEIIDLVKAALAVENLSKTSLVALATVDIKADEAGLLAAARHFGVPLRLFTVGELKSEEARLVTPSAVVAAAIGAPGIAEAAALKAGELLVPKQKSKRATCAIGGSPVPLDVASFGRAVGQLHLVGIGPGDAASRTASATLALEAATDWVGYGLYLDLIADVRSGQAEHRFPLGDEEARVRHALDLAGSGRTVALVCSGDAQIYAMAALVFELLDPATPRHVGHPASRVAVASHPGISALQAASARVGALLGHDFCAISLSDLLTPRDAILARLEAAATADFVTALYNPRSLRRTDLIERAKAIFLTRRPAETPVILATSLGRPEENVRVTTLAAFDPAEIDMLTIVLIGASSSRAFSRGDGSIAAYTPRGYANKAEATP